MFHTVVFLAMLSSEAKQSDKPSCCWRVNLCEHDEGRDCEASAKAKGVAVTAVMLNDTSKGKYHCRRLIVSTETIVLSRGVVDKWLYIGTL